MSLESAGTLALTDLNAFQRDCMAVVAQLQREGGPYGAHNGRLPHGLAIKSRLEESYPCVVHHGRLYPNLDALVEKGFVEKRSADERTNGYALTSRGRRELRVHAETISAAVREVHVR